MHSYEIGTTSFVKEKCEWEALDYGEAQLYYNNNPTKYRAIFKRNELITIQSMRYKLFPNEKAVEVAAKLSEKLGSENMEIIWARTFETISNWGTQVYVMSPLKEIIYEKDKTRFSHGLSMYNSVDGSLKFGMRTFLYLKSDAFDHYILLPRQTDLTVYARKHMKNLETDVKKLMTMAVSLLEHDKDLAIIIETLSKTQTSQWHQEELKKILPDKFFGTLDFLWTNFNYTLLDTYQKLTHEIWSNDRAELPAKIIQFDGLHEKIFDMAWIQKVIEE